ncbi:MAG: stage II sporulation protein D [Clostridia bacterium]|nr:stage II sporulation protein D [Clostridia bacterium]
MRNFISLVLSFCIIMASVPVVSLFYKKQTPCAGESESTAAQTKTVQNTTEKTQQAESTSASARKADKIAVYLHKEDKTVQADLDFYILSVLAKEIDIHAPEEALKAQAVCIYTFLKHAMEQSGDTDYDITDDPAHHQAFLTRAQLKSFWGESYKENYQKLQKIVDAVKGEYLSYEGQTVLAAYHSSNAGKTESAAVYWGEDYPYLQPVTSIGDTLCERYKTKVVFTPEALKTALEKARDKTFSFPESPSDWLGEIHTSPSGTVLDIAIAGATLTGREMRELLALKSSFFTLRYVKGNFLLKVSGYGHGVGLSQEGAKYMASLGFSYKDILLHYYNGVAIKDENAL